MKTIKIFLGSSITELETERVLFGDYIMNSVRPIFQADGIETELIKCEDIHSGNFGGSSQKEIDDRLRSSDISVFIFKTKAGEKTLHEFDVARMLQNEKRHEIYLYCFDLPEEQKSEGLKAFQSKLAEEDFYWKAIKGLDKLKSEFILGLLKYERSLLGMKPLDTDSLETETEKDGDARFALFEENEAKQTKLREQIHQDIENLLQEREKIMADEEDAIAEKIVRIITLYKKADQWAKATDYNKEKYSDLLFDYASFLYDYGLYHDAEAVYLRQISFAEELYGKEHEKTATSYNNIGLVYDNKGDYAKALEYHFKALTIWEKVLGREHPSTATSYNNIGLVYDKKGDYGKALEYHFKGLAIREEVLGTKHPDTANSYNNIGLVYMKQSDYDKALKYYFKALAIRENALVTEHPSTATLYNNIGAVYKAQDDYGKALEYHFKALAIKEKTLGTEHPDTATSYNNIGSVYVSQGDYGKALEYYFKALEIFEKVLGMEHPNTAQSYNNISFVHFSQNNYEEALEYADKAYKIYLKVLGPEHPNTRDALVVIDIVKKTFEIHTKK